MSFIEAIWINILKSQNVGHNIMSVFYCLIDKKGSIDITD